MSESKKAKVIAVANQKGGVTKTTTTRNLGTALAQKEYRVLLIDCDPQGSLSICCGLEDIRSIENTIADILLSVAEKKILPNNLEKYIVNVESNLDLIPANGSLTNAMAAISRMSMGREKTLKKLISALLGRYDYIFIDCQPSVDVLPLNALVASESVIITVQPDALSLEGVQSLVETIVEIKEYGFNDSLKVLGILIAMVDKRTSETKLMISQLNDIFGEQVKVFDAKIPFSTKVKESNRLGKSVLEHDPKGKAAVQYRKFAEEIIHEIG